MGRWPYPTGEDKGEVAMDVEMQGIRRGGVGWSLERFSSCGGRSSSRRFTGSALMRSRTSRRRAKESRWSCFHSEVGPVGINHDLCSKRHITISLILGL